MNLFTKTAYTIEHTEQCLIQATCIIFVLWSEHFCILLYFEFSILKKQKAHEYLQCIFGKYLVDITAPYPTLPLEPCPNTRTLDLRAIKFTILEEELFLIITMYLVHWINT